MKSTLKYRHLKIIYWRKNGRKNIAGNDAAFMRMMLKKIISPTGHELVEGVDGSDGVCEVQGA